MVEHFPTCRPRVLTAPPYFKFIVENITVVSAPLLKAYYWDYINVDKLNEQLSLPARNMEYSINMPTQQINSTPQKITFWLKNCSTDLIELRLKRIQNCTCLPLQTRVGFNQFRYLYRCPHRQMIKILQEYMIIEPGELVAFSQVYYSFLYGEHKLTYDISCNDGRIIRLNFFVDIIGFDPQKCIITSELIPTDLREFRRFVQPIWIRNITMQELKFQYNTRERGLKIVNPNLTIPRLSVWPLLVEYRPTDYENNLELTLTWNTAKTKFIVKARGVLDADVAEPVVPIKDIETADFLYVIYPNKLEFITEPLESKSLLVAVHNYNQKCREFRWQNYNISQLFEVSFEPAIFRLKPHHSKLCMVNLRVFQQSVCFRRVPVVLEVHRIFDKNTKLAKELLDEVESIDDPKWKEDSYLQHVLLHLNIRVNFKKREVANLKWEPESPRKKVTQPKKKTTTIFEKLFWEYLSKSDFMRESKLSDTLTYEEVMNLSVDPPQAPKPTSVTKANIFKILNQLTAEACSDISQNWRFVPCDLFNEMN